MPWNLTARALAVAVIIAGQGELPLTGQGTEPIAANDNRRPAGELSNGVLTLQLEMRKGNWHPEGEDGEAIPVYAFSERGKSLEIPGPLIRVPQGTTIDLSLHNVLGVPATLHGLHQRPGDDRDVITVSAGTTQKIRFVAGVPGTYLYWARTPDGQRGNDRLLDALLGGALVVDPLGSVAQDRVFVLERWHGPTRTAINGKSWPYTERLTYQVGESVHWRVINASDLSHPMHLHGSHFNVDGVGDGEHYQAFAGAARPLVFTQLVEVGETYDMTWVPQEPGRWLFHCHRLPHMRLPVALDASDVAVMDNHEHAHDDPAYAGMGGMIMGVTVTGHAPKAVVTAWKPARSLELVVDARKGDPRFFQVAVRETGQSLTGKEHVGSALTGPPVVLTQHQPVEIAVINRLRESISIHWHGIELESYYDGVPLWGGVGASKAPAVGPGERFVVKMTPSRAGTFIYHTHWHDATQLTGGIHGPLIIMPPGQAYDPATDRSFVFSQGPNEPYGAALLLMNGIPQPSSVQLKTRTKYRLRFINITPSVANLRVSLKQSGVPVRWRMIAKDAVDLGGENTRPADQLVSVGETYDFEYEAAAPQELTLEGLSPNDMRRAVQTFVFTDRM